MSITQMLSDSPTWRPWTNTPSSECIATISASNSAMPAIRQRPIISFATQSGWPIRITFSEPVNVCATTFTRPPERCSIRIRAEASPASNRPSTDRCWPNRRRPPAIAFRTTTLTLRSRSFGPTSRVTRCSYGSSIS